IFGVMIMMKKENLVSAPVRGPTVRVTRAQAAASLSSGAMISSEVSKLQDQKRALRKNYKRSATEEKTTSAPINMPVAHKRRAVLKDVTNICCDKSYKNCLNVAKLPKKNGNPVRKGSADISKVALSGAAVRQFPADSKAKLGKENGKPELQSEEVLCSVNLDKNVVAQLRRQTAGVECSKDIPWLEKQHSGTMPLQLGSLSKKGNAEEAITGHSGILPTGKISLYSMLAMSSEPDFTDIDSDHKDPQLCSLYAPEIYSNLRAAELMRRPHSNFMEMVQRDVTQSMRGILVDWLVEVCEEYKLVPDTLYLTVYLIDLFLSEYYIERQKLQLLGITCMLIASKYEEICAPRIEEFCFITDNTYTKEEVWHLSLSLSKQKIKMLAMRID
ncbi:hypothetical protein RJ639_047462, partial [Escallonia herrerae]